MITDNELREMIEVHLGQAGVLGRIDPILEKNLIRDLVADIKQHADKRAASELEAIRSAMTEFAKMGDREWFSIAGLKYINDRLNQFQESK